MKFNGCETKTSTRRWIDVIYPDKHTVSYEICSCSDNGTWNGAMANLI